jgi:shoulder domain-containing protein
MSVETRQKIPVPRRSFLWSLNETSGEILTHVGPTEFTPSANDRIVRANNRGGYEPAPMEARPFIIARDGEYVLVENPVASDAPDGGPNGAYVPGGNKEKELRLGTKKIIPGPCAFPLWPGQSAEVRLAHKLSANQYLLVEVVGPLDESAPYYRLVIASAGLSSVVIDGAEGEGEGEARAPQVEAAGRGQGTQLRVGQRIVIQGRHTQFFIPPTGIEVVPALEESEGRGRDEDGIAALAAGAREELAKTLAQVGEGMTARQFSVVKNELRHRQDLSSGERGVMLAALDDAWNDRQLARRSRGVDAGRGGTADPYARRAVVLGPKTFCYLFDADGNPRIVRGPARVFPGPHDTFLQRGSRRRVYDAYELGEHQALYLRVITPISRDDLAKRLPPGTALERAYYEAGAELLVRGLPSVFFPFIEAEVLSPLTREPHVGNDHEGVIVQAIGIDQKSGIYVRDQRTGMVNMIRGETSYLVDPRVAEHVHRRVPADRWNLWIAHADPHKAATADVVTPWALSVSVPNNEAVLITSRLGRRVVVGPSTELLEFEEQLTPLKLSRGASKDGLAAVTTCFLRVRGERTADEFEVVSSDFVGLRVRLELAAHFEGEPERWFDVEDPIKLLCDAARARVRDAARAAPAARLFAELPGLVRAALLGAEGPLRFAENGMTLDEVNVLSFGVVDASLSDLFAQTQREAVSLELQGRQARLRLEAARARDAVDAEEYALLRQSAQRGAEARKADANDEHAVTELKERLAHEREHAELRARQAREQMVLAHEREHERQRAELAAANRVHLAEAEAKAQKLVDASAEARARAMAEIERETAAALSAADVQRLRAIQAELVAALHAAADSEVLKAAANNMNLVSLLGGRSPAELLGQIVRGTPLARSVDGMRDRKAPEPASE